MPDLTSTTNGDEKRPCICLVGAGTVGRSILHQHLTNDVDVVLIDANQDAITRASREVIQRFPNCHVAPVQSLVGDLPTLRFMVDGPNRRTPLAAEHCELVIESVTENLSLKQSMFVSLRGAFGKDMLLTSNTSNLRIGDIFEPLGHDPNCCGMHFFMPVEHRPLIECVSTGSTSTEARMKCESHARRLHKATLHVKDSPGFVVNRLLAPYLNQSMLVMEYGFEPEQVELAAKEFGMPMSPLALIDTIGIRTAFDSGRVFWQAFPSRLEPSSILPGMLKAMKTHPNEPIAFLESNKSMSPSVSSIARSVIQRYQREHRSLNASRLASMLAIPMWIEAAEVLRQRLVDDSAAIERAMRDGLGFRNPLGFWGYFDDLGKAFMLDAIEQGRASYRSLVASGLLIECLQQTMTPSEAVMRYVDSSEGND